MKQKIWTIIYSIDSKKQHESVLASSKKEAILKIINSKKTQIKIIDVFMKNNNS